MLDKGKPCRCLSSTLAFGGLWESWKQPDGAVLRTYAIITTTANEDMAGLHDRMPVVLEPDAWEPWLSAEASSAAALLRPAPAATLRMWPVSRAVNNVRNHGAALIEPIPDGASIEPAGGPNSA